MLPTESPPRRAPAEVLWGQALPSEHALQLYPDSLSFLDALEGFASAGLRAGEGVIIIATAAHRAALDRRLLTRGYALAAARAADLYRTLDAEAALAQFLVAGWPDETLFRIFLKALLKQARGAGRPVRAFGEMVAVLWQHGEPAATLRLEQLWDQLQAEAGFRLFCAYPRSSFSPADAAALAAVCAVHSRVLLD